MTRTASDVLIETIHAWGVDVVFGLPGDSINGIMEVLPKRQDQVRFVQVRHEESAAFMACGYAKHTGRLGCCLATSACGAKGYTVEKAAQCGDVLDEALRTAGPVVIEAVADPNEPPMPPKITARQAAHFAESLTKGTPDRRKIIEDILEDKVRVLV
jgi:thiamine pyrophosphate-dependent acetolactate synthase large subunit-like protein